METTKELSWTERTAADLVRTAQKAGRWEAPIGWWGQGRGSLEGIVAQDLEFLRNGADPAALLARCVDGADEEDHASWGEYVDDLAAALGR